MELKSALEQLGLLQKKLYAYQTHHRLCIWIV